MKDIERGRDIARIGVLGAATLSALAGGAMALSSAQEFHRLQHDQRAAAAGTSVADNPEARRLVPRMTQSLEFAVGGSVVFVAGSMGAIAAGASLVNSSRKRQ